MVPVQVVAVGTKPSGKASVMTVPFASDVPLLRAVIVKVTVPLAATVAGPCLAIVRSAVAVGVPTTVVTAPELLLPRFGSVTPAGAVMLAVLVSVPEAGAVPVIVNRTCPIAGKVGIARLLSVVKPAVDGQTAPPDARQVMLTPVSAAGTASLMVAPLAAPG